MAKTASSPRLANEAQLPTNYLHSSIVVFGIIQCEISNLILNLVGFDNVEDFSRDIGTCVAGAELGDPYRNLARLVVFVPEKTTHSI